MTIGKRTIGKGVVRLTPAGWWFASWLNRRDEYERYMLELAEMGKLGYSSGADPETVCRKAIRPGVNHIEYWDTIEGSLTPIPADPGNQVNLKALALKAGARHSASDRADMQGIHDLSVRQGAVCGAAKTARQRAMLMELELIEIETEQNRAAILLADLGRLVRG